jgi:hypothetical protein
MATQFRKESFLRNAPALDEIFLDINTVPTVPPSLDDVEWQIEPKYAERPDVLAAEIYGSSRYWWVFAARNPDVLKDPLRDFTSGTTIFLPAENSVYKNGA